ncbi:MAG: hypothetical protein ABI599_11795 [Flavobacteriales bacterium]
MQTAFTILIVLVAAAYLVRTWMPVLSRVPLSDKPEQQRSTCGACKACGACK